MDRELLNQVSFKDTGTKYKQRRGKVPGHAEAAPMNRTLFRLAFFIIVVGILLFGIKTGIEITVGFTRGEGKPMPIQQIFHELNEIQKE